VGNARALIGAGDKGAAHLRKSSVPFCLPVRRNTSCFLAKANR
jgi:hypothetical protein